MSCCTIPQSGLSMGTNQQVARICSQVNSSYNMTYFSSPTWQISLVDNTTATSVSFLFTLLGNCDFTPIAWPFTVSYPVTIQAYPGNPNTYPGGTNGYVIPAWQQDPANWTPQIATSTSPPQVVWFLSFDSSAPGWCISTVVQNQMMYLSSSNLASDSPSNLYTPILTATFPLTTSEYWWMDATSYSVGPPQGKGTFGVPGSSFSPYYLFSASNPSTTPACFPSIPPQPCPPPPAIPPPITINWDMAQMPLGQCGCGDWTFGIPACVINAPTISNGANYSTYVDNFSNPCCASEESPANITLNTNVPPGSTVNVNANQTCCCDCNLRVVNESNYPVYINGSYSGGTVQGYIFPTNNTSAYQCGVDNSQVYTQVGWNNGSGSPQSLCPSGTVYIGDQVADFAMDSLEDCLGDPECVEALAPDD